VPDQATVRLVGDSLLPLLQGTLRGTLPLTAISFVLGLVMALVVALMRLSPVPPVQALPAGTCR
jgi:L-cystine transport system permease protein